MYFLMYFLTTDGGTFTREFLRWTWFTFVPSRKHHLWVLRQRRRWMGTLG